MIDIDFIKWMCEKAEGFSLRSEDSPNKGDFSITIPLPNTFLCSWCNHLRTDLYKTIYYPLLLQRAIEGVTRSHAEKSTRYWIEISYDSIEVYDSDDNTITANLYFNEFQGDIDQAKEAALKYIYEQENSNE